MTHLLKRTMLYAVLLLICLKLLVGAAENSAKVRNECMTPRKLEGCEKTGYTEKDTYFYLFTQKNHDNPEKLHDCGRKLPENTNFDPKNPTEIIVHGYMVALCLEAWMREIKNELLKRGNYNVILIDWSGRAFDDYPESVRGLQIAAKETAELIDNIKEKTHVGADNFHVIGHSLGSHFAGFIGKSTKIKRITALDPAGPHFNGLPSSKRLDKTDAEYVDAIHTEAGRCFPQYGYLYPIGHDDFYVNGGAHQSSCYYAALESLLKGDIIYALNSLVLPVICSHVQSQQYYKVSINAGNHFFIGKKCKNYHRALKEKCSPSCKSDGSNCAVMGMDWLKSYNGNKRKSRVFVVKTSIECPYALPDKPRERHISSKKNSDKCHKA